MERESNVTVWQLGLFDGFDKDVMVMQRDEEEVFDGAIHVFFEKEYYDAYVSKAKKYSEHRYAYHEDKLGEVIYQIFDEEIPEMVFHVTTQPDVSKSTLCEEKYISVEDLMGLHDVVENYHYMYTASIERMSKEEAVAKLWTKNVFIIGNLPDFRKVNTEEKQTIELMTMKRKADGSAPSADDFDYESLKVFLTAGSAMRFNPDKKPINRYKLSLLSQFVKGRFQVVIEPHRNYYLEFDPATIDISEHYQPISWNEEKVKERIKSYLDMEEVFILLAPNLSDYRSCKGIPLFVRPDAGNVMMYLFEKYTDAMNYCLLNPAILPVLDGTYPIGVLNKNDKMTSLKTVLAIAANMGVTGINLDMETENAIGSKMPFFVESAQMETELEKIFTPEECARVKVEKDGNIGFRFEPISFADTRNIYNVSEERQAELKKHLDTDNDMGVAYMAGCTLPEMLVMLREAGQRFDAARNEQKQEEIKKYNVLMNLMTIPLTEELCEKPYVYTLRGEDGEFTLRNNIGYLIVTNRFESGRNGEGRLMPVSVANEQFMSKLLEASKVVAITDGPGLLALADVRLMIEVAKQKKKNEPLKEELMIYLTQGLNLSYQKALYYYRRLKTDNSIFVEFTSCVRNGEYSSVGMVTVEGYTAKKLADEKGLNPLQAYDMLLQLKENPKALKENKAVEMETKTAEVSAEKKSFFGRLFKK
ncbi:MAG: hypothetical protein IJO85_03470 [Lachnospiraceae bacterium]|nr:hypothetical protein [Lachnospiraceae bacterium]